MPLPWEEDGPPPEPPASAHPATLPDDEILKDCSLERGRAQGPGGQHRNKVSTAVILTHDPTGAQAQANERRSPADNERMALRRLRLALATEHRTAPPTPRGFDECTTALWRSRRRERKIACNPRHRDYPSLLAEALDVVSDSKWDARKAATRMGVTPSQLIRLVADHPPALAMWNAHRQRRGKTTYTP